MTIKVLDHGVVSLVDTMPRAELIDLRIGYGDRAVLNAARVSTGYLPTDLRNDLGLFEEEREERTEAKDIKLLHYLLNNKHHTPFEMVRFKFFVKLPIMIARQFIRHRMGSYNEISARYSVLKDEFYIPALERCAFQSTSNKQGSGDNMPVELAQEVRNRIVYASRKAYEDYTWLLEQGTAKELARMILPTNVYTAWYWLVDLRNLMGFLSLRMESHAQWEAREYAKAFFRLAKPLAPVTMQWFADNNPEVLWYSTESITSHE